MTLIDYCKQHKITVSEFARLAGIEVTTAWRAANRRGTPTRRTVDAIVEATGGAVTPNDLFGIGGLDSNRSNQEVA